jgi:outer membrane receptor protein involved in Fe transport
LSKNQTIKISYAFRIQRPGWWNLNPFINTTDPLNISEGNPALVPERTNNIDLSYFQSFEKGSSILIMLYYRVSKDDEQSYYLPVTPLKIGDSVYQNVSINTSVNAGTQYTTGINISGTLKLFDEKMEIRGNLTFFNKYIVSQIVAGATSTSYNYRTNLNISYKFTPTLVAECYENYRSPMTEIQGKFPSFNSYSMAIRKMFWDRKGSLAFTTTNAFTPYVDQATNIAGQNFTMVSDRKVPYQSFGLSFTYKFGKMEYKENKQGDMGGGEEMN